MTETHTDFLPASGAIVVVVCATENVLLFDGRAFEHQVQFARDVCRGVEGREGLRNVPVTVVLVSNGVARQSHEAAAREFGSLILLDEYSPAALGNAVKIMFGKGTVG